MLKRIFNFSSPVGIALTVAGVVLALSPEARKATRRMLVKGTAFVLGTVDQARNAADNISDMMLPDTTESRVEETKPEYH